MKFKYFTNNYDSIEAIKKHFRQLAKQYHSDFGGTDEQFRELHSEYEYLIKNFIKTEYKDIEVPKYIQELIDKLIYYDDLELELVGTWLWVGGNTLLYKDNLKKLGLFYSSKHHKWYYNGMAKKVRKCTKSSIDEIKQFYGVKEVKSVGTYKLA